MSLQRVGVTKSPNGGREAPGPKMIYADHGRPAKATIDKTCCSQQLSSHKCHSQNCIFISNELSSCECEIVGARKQLGKLWNSLPMIAKVGIMTAVGFELTQLALVELESTPLDHSGKLSLRRCFSIYLHKDFLPNTSGLVVCNINPSLFPNSKSQRHVASKRS